jgi:hypothetical protein
VLPDFSETEKFYGLLTPDIIRPTKAEGHSGYFKNIALTVSEEGRVAFTLGYASGNFQCQTGLFARASLKHLKSLDLPIFFSVYHLRQFYLFRKKCGIFYTHFVRFFSSKLQVQYV